MQIDAVTVIFAFLALFVLWKLRSVLGERSGFEQDPDERRIAAAQASPVPAGANVDTDGRWSDFAERGGAVWQGLDAIAAAQPDFSPKSFLDGASAAYEMVVQAFARGDEATLHSLASDDVFASFKGALTERSRLGETLETTLVGLNSVKIVEARQERDGAVIAVRFDSQFITATRNREGVVIEGDPSKPSNVIDIWAFARRNGATAPNWTLVSTNSGQ